jgi:tetratricopeptide (TPR) repeat protein
MKNHIFALCLSLLTGSLLGQTKTANNMNFNRLLNKGIESYNAERYNEALESFKRAEAINPEPWKLNYWMAACYYELTSYLTAETYITNAVNNLKENEDAEATFYELQGKINHRIGKVDNAIMAFKKASILMGTKVAKEYGIALYIEQCERMIQANKAGIVNLRKPLSVQLNSLEEEYAPILCDSGAVLFFTARRPETTGEKINPDDSKYFEDVYRAVWNPITSDYDIDYNFFQNINTNGFDALSYVNSNGTYALMTVNTSSAEKTTKSSDLFEINTDSPFSWELPIAIKSKNLNTDFFEGSATCTENGINGDFLVFTSDRKADISGLDLFQCSKNEGIFGEVTALPKTVNSEGNETTPFITSDGMYLFFSSDELPGYGGYDIFYSSNENGIWSLPVNLGPEVNTVNNDTHFNIDLKTKRAVFASLAEKDSFFSYDLFMVDLKDKDFPFFK